MALTAEQKKEILGQYGLHESDTGSPEAQVALLEAQLGRWASLLASAAALTGAGVQVLHATGTAAYDEIAAALPTALPAPYVVVPYLTQMQRAYAAADLALVASSIWFLAVLAGSDLPATLARWLPASVGAMVHSPAARASSTASAFRASENT